MRPLLSRVAKTSQPIKNQLQGRGLPHNTIKSTNQQTPQPVNENLQKDPNNRREPNPNFINLDKRYNPNRAAKVDTLQLSLTKENKDSCDEEYEAETNPYEERGSYTRSIAQGTWEQQHELLGGQQQEIGDMKEELASLRRQQEEMSVFEFYRRK